MSNKAKKTISEGELQYGSHKEPTPNRKDEKRIIAVNEDHLYNQRDHIIEIKSTMFNKPAASESDEDSVEMLSRRRTPTFQLGNVRYDEIGYGPYNSQNPRYVVLKNTQANHDCKQQPKKSKCGCRKDLLVEETSLSEQSATFEDNSSDQYLQPRTYFTS